MKKQLLYLLAVTAVAAMVFVTGCQKETSFEGSNNPAKGSLQADLTGDCLPKTVNGIYAAGTALVPATNTITVQVNVTQTGTYVVTTDTVNGYFFRATGTFTTLGAATVTLRGNGTPFAQGTNNFVVSFDGTVCDIAVVVLPAGAGAAVFTLAGTPSCTTPVINGTYTVGVPLAASNTVVLNVNVTTAGSYNITTAPAVNGITFSGTGTLAAGPQTITLTASGNPTTAGPNTIPITAGASTCSFVVTVGAGAAGTVDCTAAVISGTYNNGVALTAANTVQISVNVTTAGPYTISTNTVVGISFSATGNFAATGPATVTLVGTGTPTATGAQTYTVTWGASTCTFNVTITGAPVATGTVNCASAVISGTYTVGVAMTGANTAQISVNVATTGTYTISTNTVAGISFSATGNFAATGPATVTLVATGTPTVSGAQTFTVTWGASTCTFNCTIAPAPSNDYFPRTTNSNWSYEWNDDNTDSVLKVVIPTPLVVAPNTYAIFMPNDGGGLDSTGNYSAGYYRKSGGDYFERFDYGAFIGYDNPGWAEYIMLKDNVPASPAAGSNWKSAGFQGTITPPGNTFNIRFSYTVIQKDVPISVTTSTGTVNYTNVIVVEEKYEAFNGTTWQDITTTVGYNKSYYARGIGLIKFEAFNPSLVLTDWMELRRYVVF